MKKVFIVKVENFETQMIMKMLKEKEEKGEIVLFVVERGESTLSDDIKSELRGGYIVGKQVICVNYEPTEEEEKEEPCLKSRIVLFDDDDNFSLLERVQSLISNSEATKFQKLVAANTWGYIPAMRKVGETYYSNEKNLKRQIKNVLKGECIARGISRLALLEAELAVKNKKVIDLYDGGTLTVVRYPYEDIGPVMNLLWRSYEDLIIQNPKTGGEIVFTPRERVVWDVKVLCDNTWTSKNSKSTKWRIFCKEGGALKTYKSFIKRKK
ncbi:hypothetical protein EUA76_01105 [TM7 phylum sp. oral taxon 350]|nr:hypothetical protein EUA76_01105 [TM7 phylum sp. oral taxon 350]